MPAYSLYNADCLTVLNQLPDESIDVVITDPPYGIDYQSTRIKEKERRKPKIKNDLVPQVDFIPIVYKKMRPNSSLFVFCRWDVEYVFIKAIKDAGFKLKGEIIWDKMLHGSGDALQAFAPRHENILHAIKGRREFKNGRPDDVIRVMRVPSLKLKHPNEKPVELFEYILSKSSVEGETVLDCYMGVGPAGVACKKLNRNFIGIDLDEKYFNIAKQRIEEA